MPSEYARDVFDGPEGHSKPERTARLLAERCPAVADYRVYRTGMDQAHLEKAQPALEVHMQRSRPGAALQAAQSTQAPAVNGPAGRRPSNARDISFPGRSTSAGPQPSGSRPQRGPSSGRDGGVER